MIYIKAGAFEIGSTDFNDTLPLHKVNSFWMDEHEVTNAQFEEFAKATHYITIAERPLNPKDFLDVSKTKLVIGSAVFSPPKGKVSLDDPLQWWKHIAGTNWKHPNGPNSNIIGHDNEPVVQVCYLDALAYAKWAGKRLPTEAEWEYAARAGKQNKNYYWGDEQKPNGNGSQIFFRVISPIEILTRMDMRELLLLNRIRQMVLVCMIWKEMRGNDATIFTDLIIIKAMFQITPKDLMTALTPMNPVQ